MKNPRFVFVLILLLAASGYSQSASKVVGTASKAHGGEKVLKAITTRQFSGKITRLSDGASGNWRITASQPGFVNEAFDIGGFEYASGYNGKSSWTRDSKNGLRTMTGEAARDFQAEALYRSSMWLRAKDEKAKLTSGGTAQLEGKPANVVVMTTAKGARIKMYFDTGSGLLVREEMPFGGMARAFDYSDHRSINGIQTPFTIKYSSDGETYDIRLASATYGQPVARSAFDFPVVSNEPLPNIPRLLDEIRANTDRVDAILENYSYTETRIERELNKNGDFVEKGSEKRALTFYKGYRITRTIEKNGRPLSASDQAKEDRDAQKQVEDIEKRIAEKERKQISQRDTGAGSAGQPNGEGQRITIADALKGSVLVNPRRERFGGRDVIVFDYEPNPSFKPRTRNEKLFSICSGAVWVDTATKQIIRLEATLTQSTGNFLAKAKRGASFTIENELVNNEVWLPSRADINLEVKILFAGININNLVKYGDYRRFETEVKDAKVGEPEKP